MPNSPPSNKLLVADAGPLIGLGRIGQLTSLTVAAKTVLVPDVALAECLPDPTRPGAAAISRAVQQGLLVPASTRELSWRDALSDVLDAGESAAIALALARRSAVQCTPAR